MKMVKIKWNDAQLISGIFHSMDEVKTLQPIFCEIIGFLLHKDANRTIICQEVWQDDFGFKYLHVIPNSVIIEVKEISVSK